MKQALIIVTLCCMALGAAAQDNRLVHEGNVLYQQQKYKEAANAYEQALKKDPNNTPGNFNLGNALIQQKQYDAARKTLANTAKTAKDKKEAGAASYNIGNTYMNEQKYSDAVEAYKNALRRNPNNVAAKYNLSYALEKMKQQQDKNNQNKNQNKNDKNKQNQKQQPQKGDQNKDEQNKDQQNGNKGDKEQQRSQPQPGKLSEQQADQILNALSGEEKKLQDKKQKENGTPVRLQKDW